MRIQLFGSISAVGADGQEVSLGGPKQRTALAMLCLDPGHAVSTDRLIGAVWGDKVPERATRSLSTYMSNLRRGTGDVIESGTGSYTLRVDRSQIDVCAFTDAMDSADTVEAYRDALSMWTGTPFDGLDGFGAFRDEGQRLANQRLTAERSVIEAAVASGDAVGVVPQIEALVQEFPFDEGLRGLHMRGLYGVGRQVEALESFNSFKNQLADELGLDPSPELQDLELKILQQDDSLAGAGFVERLVSEQERSQVPFPGYLTKGHATALIGRDEALGQLDAAYAAASDGIQVIAVIGEPGIGKTSLTATWAEQNTNDGAMVVAGRCTPDAALPYQPFIEIAKAVLAAQPDRIGSVGPAAGSLALLVPGAGDGEELPPPIQADPDTVEYLMAEAFATLLAPSGGDPATVAILDDLHWADPESIAVLGHLARRTDDMALLIIANYRDTDLISSHPLPGLLTDLRRERRLDRLLLDRLSNEQVGAMITAHFGVDASEQLVTSIAEETRGNPFFIEELTRHLQDEHAIDSAGQWVSAIPIEEYGIPEGLRDVIGRRLGRLGEDATTLLKVAAVIGPAFSIDMAGAIAGLDGDRIDAVADAATTAAIIDEANDTGECSFSHALIRQTLYEELSTRRRTRLHLTVGEAIEETNGQPAIALRHWLAANQPDRALAAAIRAADTSRTISASLKAREHLELALELWGDIDDPEAASGVAHAELVLRLATSYVDFTVLGNEDRRWETVELVLREIGSSEAIVDTVRGRLHSELALVLVSAARHEEGMEHSLRAVRLVPSDPPSVDRAAVTANHARVLTLASRAEESIVFGHQALEMAHSFGSDSLEATAVSALATSYATLGKMAKSDMYFAEVRRLAERTGRVRDHFLVYVNQGDAKRHEGELDTALSLSDQGSVMAVEFGLHGYGDFLRANAAQILFELDRWNEAAERIESITGSGTMSSTEMNRQLTMATIGAERGAYDGLVKERQFFEEAGIATLNPQYNGPVWSALISDWRWRGDFADAFTISQTAFNVHTQLDEWRDSIWLTAYSIELVADALTAGIGEPSWVDLAQRWHDRFMQENPATYLAAPLKVTSTADLARAKGENSPALWRDAIDAWDEGSYHQAKARWRLAEALIESGPQNLDIEPNLDLAQDVAERLGAQPLLTAIEATRRVSAAAPAPPGKG